jgi:hypothetical protein
MIVSIIFTLIGYVMHIWFIAEACMLIKAAAGPTERFFKIRHNLNEYMIFKELPLNTRKRIMTYYEYNFKNKFYHNREIVGSLGCNLKSMIAMEMCGKLLSENYVFKLLPNTLLHAIATSMSEKVYLKNDVISHNDQQHLRGQVLIVIYATHLFLFHTFMHIKELMLHLTISNCFSFHS